MPKGIYERSEAHKRKMNETLKGKHPKGKNHHQFGKPRSDKTKKLISAALTGENHPNYGKHHSEETRRRMREACKGRIIPPRTEEHLRHPHSLLHVWLFQSCR